MNAIPPPPDRLAHTYWRWVVTLLVLLGMASCAMATANRDAPLPAAPMVAWQATESPQPLPTQCVVADMHPCAQLTSGGVVIVWMNARGTIGVATVPPPAQGGK